MQFKKGDNNPLDRMLTVDEVAYALHVHPTTIRKWAKLGQLKSYRLGARGNVRFKTEDVSYFFDSSSNTPVLIEKTSPETRNHAGQEIRLSKTDKKDREQVTPLTTAAVVVSGNEPVKKALLGTEEKFARIFSSSPLAFSVTRLKDGVIIEINNSYCHFTGYQREEILGHKVSEMNIWVNPEDRERLLRHCGKMDESLTKNTISVSSQGKCTRCCFLPRTST